MPPDPGHMPTAPQWITPARRLAAAGGMHRVVWSLHYAPQGAVGGRPGRGTDGAWAPPGDYTVTLTVAGQALTRPLALAPDPRAELEPAGHQTGHPGRGRPALPRPR